MKAGFTSYIVENDKALAAAFERLAKSGADMRIPFGQISRSFYQENKRIFTMKSAGKYPDFKTEESRKAKMRDVGFEYPLLVRSGALASSLTDRGDSAAFNVITKKTLILGTRVPYAIYHQSDRLPRRIMPLRKVVFIDGGPLETSKSKGRRNRWLNIVNTHILKSMGKAFK